MALMLMLAGCRGATEQVPAAPVYSDATQWYVTDRGGAADVFYVISTETGDYPRGGAECHYADTYADSLRAPMLAEMTGVDTLLSGTLNFYAPYYRQCSLQSFVSDSLMRARLPLATGDVKRAFEHYVRQMNAGRPIVLVGFSQGAMILPELVNAMPDSVWRRVVAVYMLGAPLTAQTLAHSPRLRPARGSDDTGVTICYNSARNTASALWGAMAAGINPVNWRVDSTPAMLITEPSPLVPVAEQQPDTMWVHQDPESHITIVTGYDATDYVLPLIGKEGCYHSREVWLYRDLLRENIARRVSRYMDTEGAAR